MKLTGLIAAPFTPMYDDGSLHPEVISDYATYLQQSGVSGVFINGTTGEGLSLSIEERICLTHEWASACKSSNLTLIAHVGDQALPSAQRLAHEAEQVGAAAIGAMPPCFFRADIDSLVAWCAAVASAAPHTPFYYYHIPSMSGVSIRMTDFLPLAVSRIPTFQGVKFTYEDLMDYQMAVEFGMGQLDILYGRDEMLLAGLACGAQGAVGSTYNYIAPTYLRLIQAFREGNVEAARREQAFSHKIVRLLQNSPNGIACGKAMLAARGIPIGPCRLPLPRLSSDDVAQLKKKLREIGFF